MQRKHFTNWTTTRSVHYCWSILICSCFPIFFISCNLANGPQCNLWETKWFKLTIFEEFKITSKITFGRFGLETFRPSTNVLKILSFGSFAFQKRCFFSTKIDSPALRWTNESWNLWSFYLSMSFKMLKVH